MMEEYYSILEQCGMFDGITQSHYQDVLECLGARTRRYAKGAYVAEVGEQRYCTGVLLEGGIEEFMYDQNGDEVNLHRFGQGDVFGAELAFNQQPESPVSLRTTADSNVMLLDFGTLILPQTLTCPCRMQVTANLMQEFAHQVLYFNTKVRIIAQKRLRDRIKVYLQTLTPSADNTYTLPYNRTELAEFLCADRSALSRELCRLRDEGILTFSGSKLHILDTTFLSR